MTWWTESILFCPASTWTFLLKNCAPSSLITSPSWASVSSSVFNSVFHPGAGVRKGHRWHDGGTGRSIAKGTLLSLAGYASSKVEFKMCDCARVVLLSFSECLLRFSCVSGNKLVSRRDSQVCHHGFQPRRAARFFEWYLWRQLALMRALEAMSPTAPHREWSRRLTCISQGPSLTAPSTSRTCAMNGMTWPVN